MIVSGVLAGAATGALAGGRLADLFGRRRLLIATAIIFAARRDSLRNGPVRHHSLSVGRIIVGLGIGLSSGTVPVYISEVSPADARGWQVSLFQLAITVGIFSHMSWTMPLREIQGWRWMFGLAVIPAAIFGARNVFPAGESALAVRRGDRAAARAGRCAIRGTSDVDAEMGEVEKALTKAAKSGGLSDLLAPSLRPALVVGIGLAIFQQITGINTVIYYAPLIIQSAGISSASGAILATGEWACERAHDDRRDAADRSHRAQPLLLTGIAGNGHYAWATGLRIPCSAPNDRARMAGGHQHDGLRCFVRDQPGPIFWLLISEIYPLEDPQFRGRPRRHIQLGLQLLVTLTFSSRWVDKLGPSLTFWVYGVCAIAAGIFSYSFVPETKGRTLEQIEESLHSEASRRCSGEFTLENKSKFDFHAASAFGDRA